MTIKLHILVAAIAATCVISVMPARAQETVEKPEAAAAGDQATPAAGAASPAAGAASPAAGAASPAAGAATPAAGAASPAVGAASPAVGAASPAAGAASPAAADDSDKTGKNTGGDDGESGTNEGNTITTRNGSQLKYGIATSLLRVRATRSPREFARERNLAVEVDKLPLDLGFQFVYRPNTRAHRLSTKDGKGFQLVSYGGILLADVGGDNGSQSTITIGAIASFFEESVSVGIGFDLYRGIPTQGIDGQRGGATAQTGLLGWALSETGEITAENFSLMLSLNVSNLAQLGDDQ